MSKSRLFLLQPFLILMTISLVIAASDDLYCADQDTSLICLGYEPVCASYQRSCSVPPCPQDLEFPNSCAACQDSMVVSYKNGSCPRACEASDVFADCALELIHPVCGVTVDGCTTADCQQSFENSCTACANSSIVSYKPGLCPQESWINCSTFSHSINCEEGALVSVCATLKEDCAGVPCQATFMSPCVACLNSNVISFVPGACEEGDNLESEVLSENMWEESSTTETDLADALIFCKKDRPTDCSLFDFDLVCAYFLIGCPEGVCSQTEVNSCTACQLQNVESYSYGRCAEERLPCDPSSRPTLCDNTSDPVCAYLINCVNGVCSETVINSCTACMDPNVQLYVSGTC